MYPLQQDVPANRQQRRHLERQVAREVFRARSAYPPPFSANAESAGFSLSNDVSTRSKQRDFIPGYSVTTRLPAVRGAFGYAVYTYSTAIRADQVLKVLGHDPRSEGTLRKRLRPELRELYETIQRPTQKGRRGGIADYVSTRISNRRVGGFPAISIGLAHPPGFEPFDERDPSFGWIIIEEDAVILDGLGRVTGLIDLYESGEDGKDAVRKIVLPVTFYAPSDDSGNFNLKRDGAQLFTDFNFKVNPVPVRVAISKDEYDPWVQLANELGDQDFISEHGGMSRGTAAKKKEIGAKPYLVSQQTMNRVARGACEGRTFQESNIAYPVRPHLTEETEPLFTDQITYFFTQIEERMGTMRWEDSQSFHLSSPGLQALGLLFHDLFVTLNPQFNGGYDPKLSKSVRGGIFDAVAAVDWSRENKEVWVDELQLGVWHVPTDEELAENPRAHPSVVIRGAGRTTTQTIHTYLREITGVAKLLELVPNKTEPEESGRK